MNLSHLNYAFFDPWNHWHTFADIFTLVKKRECNDFCSYLCAQLNHDTVCTRQTSYHNKSPMFNIYNDTLDKG